MYLCANTCEFNLLYIYRCSIYYVIVTKSHCCMFCFSFLVLPLLPNWLFSTFFSVRLVMQIIRHLNHVCSSATGQLILNKRQNGLFVYLTLKVLVVTIDAQWEGMGDVGSVRYGPTLLPPCVTMTVLSTVTSKFLEIQHFKG